MKMADIINDLRIWIADIYRQHGWQAALIALVVIVGLLGGVAWLFGLPFLALLGVQ